MLVLALTGVAVVCYIIALLFITMSILISDADYQKVFYAVGSFSFMGMFTLGCIFLLTG